MWYIDNQLKKKSQSVQIRYEQLHISAKTAVIKLFKF